MSTFPRQCKTTAACRNGGPSCKCIDPDDPLGKITGVTIEFLVKFGHFAKMYAFFSLNLALLALVLSVLTDVN